MAKLTPHAVERWAASCLVALACVQQGPLRSRQLDVDHDQDEVLENVDADVGGSSAIGLLVDLEDLARDLVSNLLAARKVASVGGRVRRSLQARTNGSPSVFSDRRNVRRMSNRAPRGEGRNRLDDRRGASMTRRRTCDGNRVL